MSLNIQASIFYSLQSVFDGKIESTAKFQIKEFVMDKAPVFPKSFRFWIPPEGRTADFLLYIADGFGQTRFVYNKLKEYIDSLLEKGERLPSVFSLNKYVNKVLKDQYEWLNGKVDKFYFTHTVKEIHAAYKAFLKGDRGRPHFRCKYASKQTVTTSFTNNNIKVNQKEGWVELPYLNSQKGRRIKAVVHCPIEGRIIGGKITREATGDYFVIIYCEVPVIPLPALPLLENSVGIDVGLKTWVVCSDGKRYKSLKAMLTSRRRLRRLDKSLTRKREAAKKNCAAGEKPVMSKNYYKAKAKRACEYAYIKNRRNDYAHKVSKELIDNNQAIFSEDLNVEGMLKNHRLAKAIADAVFRSLFNKLEYKAARYGRIYLKVDRFFPSSQLCPHCGYRNPAVKDLSVREWECPVCHAINDRDLAAAENIRKEGLRLLQEVGYLNALGMGLIPKSEPVESSASSVKQEAHEL